MRPFQICLFLLTFLALCFGCASNPTAERSHAVVQINHVKLVPEVVEISGSENSVAWTNWTGSTATVQFPASIATAFTCDELRPQFVLSGDRIESVGVLGNSESLTTPCALKPGSYDYEVWLSESPSERENPDLKIKGRIEVGE